MKNLLAIAALVIFTAESLSYSRYFRDVKLDGNSAEPQSYVVVDESLWRHARPDLADLRLYNGQSEAPYSLDIERGNFSTESKAVRILQPAIVNGKTQFFLDMSGLDEYDRVQLDLRSLDFVVKARIEGQDDLHGKEWAELANTILYDLSEDSLGNNTILRLPVTRYKYLRVSLDGQVRPADILSAAAYIREEEKETWRVVSSQPERAQVGKDTIFSLSAPKNVPFERIEFFIDPGQPNFSRTIELQDANNNTLSSGQINRVHMVRHGQKIDSEQTSLDISGIGAGALKLVVHNGDDPPLKISSAQLQQYERRIYFNSASAPRLYYGDEKLGAPEYDYAKLFQKDPHAVQAQLGPEQANAAYTERPDERPWSERHPGILWAAIIAAVVILGAIALRSMKTTAPSGGSAA